MPVRHAEQVDTRLALTGFAPASQVGRLGRFRLSRQRNQVSEAWSFVPTQREFTWIAARPAVLCALWWRPLPVGLPVRTLGSGLAAAFAPLFRCSSLRFVAVRPRFIVLLCSAIATQLRSGFTIRGLPPSGPPREYNTSGLMSSELHRPRLRSLRSR